MRMQRPAVALLDARAAALDEAGLRALARAMTDTCRAPFTARSYRYPYGLVAWFEQPVGVDLERVEPADRAFAESILTPGELAAGEGADPLRLASAWSGKEALAKALGDARAYDPRRLEGPHGWPEGRAGAWRAMPLDAPPGHVGWLCWRAG